MVVSCKPTTSGDFDHGTVMWPVSWGHPSCQMLSTGALVRFRFSCPTCSAATTFTAHGKARLPWPRTARTAERDSVPAGADPGSASGGLWTCTSPSVAREELSGDCRTHAKSQAVRESATPAEPKRLSWEHLASDPPQRAGKYLVRREHDAA